MGPRALPGWYDDPVGEFDLRWWTGESWTLDVRTGTFRGTSGLEPTPVPAEEEVFWRRGDEALTTHRALVREGRRPVEVPWWSVRGVEARHRDLVLLIGYPGYTDKAERRIKAVPDAPLLVATANAWVRRHRALGR